MIDSAIQLKKLKKLNFPAKFCIKLLISAGLLTFVLTKIPLGLLGGALSECHWPYLVLSFITINLCMFVSALKWQPLLNVQELRVPLPKLLAIYYAGLFANNFLPSSIGGDALRVYEAARLSEKTKEAAASVIMERLLASLALALTAVAALALVSKTVGCSLIFLAVGGILIVCVAATGLFFYYPFTENGVIGRWLCLVGKYKEYPRELYKVLLLSFVFQGLLVTANILIFKALGADLPLIKHFLYIPVIMAVSMLPVSINGVGVREGMYVMLYGGAGIDPPAAMACSLLFFALITVTSLAGGVILGIRK